MAEKGKAADGAKGPEYYDEIFKTKPAYKQHPARHGLYPVWKWIGQRVLNVPGAQVLELGCGPGQLAEHLWTLGIRDYQGIDFSSVAIRMAKKRVPGALFYQGDIRDGHWRESQYNVVIIAEVLEHLDADLEIFTAIRPTTRIIYSVPKNDSAGHVRYFTDTAQVRKRYDPYLYHPGMKVIGDWFCGTGLIRESPNPRQGEL